jgi:YtkA-like
MRVALLGVVVLAALAIAAPASAGCWATVGVVPPPGNIGAGDVWVAEITVLQHGRNPLPDAANAVPTLTIVNADTGRQKTFRAKSTDPTAGVYTADVVFPSNGSWSYQVYDGFNSANGEPVPCAAKHDFAALDIGGGGGSTSASSGPPPASPASSDSSSGSFPAWPVGGGIAGALAAALAVALLLRRRAPREPASAA